MKHIYYFIILSFSLFLISCNASEKDIVGIWSCNLSAQSTEIVIEVHFNADKTGEMLIYNRGDLTANEFTWDIDGHLINITGNYAHLSDYNNGDSSEKSFSTSFRLRDGKLICEGILPGAQLLAASPKTNLTLTKR